MFLAEYLVVMMVAVVAIAATMWGFVVLFEWLERK